MLREAYILAAMNLKRVGDKQPIKNAKTPKILGQRSFTFKEPKEKPYGIKYICPTPAFVKLQK